MEIDRMPRQAPQTSNAYLYKWFLGLLDGTAGALGHDLLGILV